MSPVLHPTEALDPVRRTPYYDADTWLQNGEINYET
jgi:hypothetical protein